MCPHKGQHVLYLHRPVWEPSAAVAAGPSTRGYHSGETRWSKCTLCNSLLDGRLPWDNLYLGQASGGKGFNPPGLVKKTDMASYYSCPWGSDSRVPTPSPPAALCVPSFMG